MPPRNKHFYLHVTTTVLSLLVGLALSRPSAAQVFEARTVVEDTRLYFTAPLRWDQTDWLYFGTTMAAIAVAHEFDDNVRSHFVTDSTSSADKDSHGTRDALPTVALLAGTWAYAALIHSKDGYYETGTMLEAGLLTAASTTLFKYALGRERPYDTAEVDQWFSGGDSFPSLHASLAFSIGTVFAESGSDRYRWIRRIVGYGAAGATAYWRVKDTAHWTSDVVAGAALGYSTALFVLNRRDHTHRQSTASLMPVDGGLLLSYSLPLR